MITPAYAPTATERVLPRLALDFTTASLDSRVTVTRALNTATRVNASGNIETVNANLPRFDFDPVTLVCRGLLIEESRINIQYPSTPVSATGLWATVNSGSQTTGQASPDGGTNATLVTSTGGPESGYRSSTTFAANTTYTWSAYVRSNGARYAYIRAICVNGTPSADGAWFDITNGVTATKGTSITTTTITPYKDGYYRITATATTPAVIANQLWDLRTGNADGAQTSVNGQGMFFYGAQVEAGAFATSVIPTTTTSLTRNADVVSMTGANFSDWYNATAGTFVTQASTFALTTNCAYAVDDGSVANTIRARSSTSTMFFDVRSGGAGTAAVNSGSISANTIYKHAGTYNASGFIAAMNGGAAVTAAAGTLPVGVNRLLVGSDANGNYLNGYARYVAFYPQKFTSAETVAFSK